MGVRYPSVAVTGPGAAYPASGAETVILTTPPLNIPLDFAQVFLHWYIVYGVGTSTTGITMRLRRGTTTGGTLMNTGNLVQVTGGTGVIVSGCFVDTPGAVAAQQYSLTIAGTATAGAGTYGEGCMLAYAL